MSPDNETAIPKRTRPKKELSEIPAVAPDLREQNDADFSETVAAGSAAAAFIAKREAERKQEALADDPEKVYYLLCGQCGGPAIWIFRRPEPMSPLRPDMWAASYKPRRAIWPHKELWCQNCYEKTGKVHAVPSFHNGQSPVINDRILQSMDRSDYEDLCMAGRKGA